ncbi:hypothetical protein TNCV_3653141 [Trichonephila clavipes]|nr:hypothetical protein TNCV_3653141 [Trichonephila clavipes]
MEGGVMQIIIEYWVANIESLRSTDLLWLGLGTEMAYEVDVVEPFAWNGRPTESINHCSQKVSQPLASCLILLQYVQVINLVHC